mmetsp:Transcript_5947/g.14705  ORF Transcript_5947/g.14705 Transcript_5947/m.14705 type:complete len:401 (+) Transcript_5947:108-1310(+)
MLLVLEERGPCLDSLRHIHGAGRLRLCPGEADCSLSHDDLHVPLREDGGDAVDERRRGGVAMGVGQVRAGAEGSSEPAGRVPGGDGRDEEERGPQRHAEARVQVLREGLAVAGVRVVRVVVDRWAVGRDMDGLPTRPPWAARGNAVEVGETELLPQPCCRRRVPDASDPVARHGEHRHLAAAVVVDGCGGGERRAERREAVPLSQGEVEAVTHAVEGSVQPSDNGVQPAMHALDIVDRHDRASGDSGRPPIRAPALVSLNAPCGAGVGQTALDLCGVAHLPPRRGKLGCGADACLHHAVGVDFLDLDGVPEGAVIDDGDDDGGRGGGGVQAYTLAQGGEGEVGGVGQPNGAAVETEGDGHRLGFVLVADLLFLGEVSGDDGATGQGQGVFRGRKGARVGE